MTGRNPRVHEVELPWGEGRRERPRSREERERNGVSGETT